MSLNHVVIGNGWSALSVVAELYFKNEPITWITGTGAHLYAPLSVLEPKASEYLSSLLKKLEILDEEPEQGSYLREYKNKSFARPAWFKAQTTELKKQTIEESVWEPEKRAIPIAESRFSLDLATLEDRIREKLSAMVGIKKIIGVPVKGFQFSGDHAEVLLASGESIAAQKIYYADRWSLLTSLDGFPKSKNPTRHVTPMGVLQAQFTHSHSLVGADLHEVFTCIMHKDPGEEIMRSVWGYFCDEGKRSVWTVYLESEESLDNHTIAKKLRRLKQTLDRMFSSPEWLPKVDGVVVKDFLATIQNEQVSFEEDFIFSGSFTKQSELPNAPVSLGDELVLLTDGFGPSVAFEICSQVFLRSDSQNQAMNMTQAVQSQGEGATL